MSTVFSNEQLAKLVNETIPATLPADHKNALVGTVDVNGVQVVVGMRRETTHATWEITGAFQHTWTGDNRVGAKMVTSW